MNTPDPALEALIRLSHRYGGDPSFVIAGGGNTSVKSDSTLWVKASGQALGTIAAEGFAAMDRQALAALWDQKFSENTDQREKEVLSALMAARLPGSETLRPSVETLLHDLMPFRYVVHTHPTLVNALTCGQDGRTAFERLFGHEAVWIPLVNPGYILSKIVKDALGAFQKLHGRVPPVIFLQNHGIVVAADTPDEITAHYDRILGLLQAEGAAVPDLAAQPVDAAAEARCLEALVPLARTALGGEAVFLVRQTGAAVLALAGSDQSFAPVSSAFTPDHIVYYGVSPVRVDGPEGLSPALRDYAARWGKAPRIVLVKGLGAFCLGPTAKTAGQAAALFTDAVKIAAAVPAFGGCRFMTPEHIDFIVNWEVESYRSKVSSS